MVAAPRRKRTARPRSRTLPLLTLIALLLTSCGNVHVAGGASEDDATADAGTGDPGGLELDGHTFLGSDVSDDGTPRELVEGSQIRLTFEDGGLSAQAGCNTIFGGYELDGAELVAEDLGMTQIGCADDLAEQDTWLADLLTGRPALSLDGDELTLTSGGTVVTLLDRVVADPDRALVGTVWRVESLISDDAVTSAPVGVDATLTFGDDRTVAVYGGCNRGMASFTEGEGTLTIGPVGMTRMACNGDRDDVEAAVVKVLSAGELHLEIVADRLTLTADDGSGLGLRSD